VVGLWWRKAVAVGICLVGLLAGAAMVAPAAGADQGPHYYLALGGSDSVGLQPTAAFPRGQRTDDGYADDLLDSLRSQWNDVTLVQMGCPGATTETMINGGPRCTYAAGTQLAAAVAFLREHPSTALVTLDVGFNEVVHCMGHEVVDEACISLALENIRTQLPRILVALQSAGGPDLRIIGVGHYDPYLAAYRNGRAGELFASQSVDVITRLNEAMRAAYDEADIPMADVAAAFSMTDTTPTSLAGALVPRNVEQTCALTWQCTPGPLGPNKHPNDDGYEAISDAINAVMTKP
jgi:lysophospholipase L1-like esterase